MSWVNAGKRGVQTREAIRRADGVGVAVAPYRHGQFQVRSYTVFILKIQAQAVETDSHIAIRGVSLSKAVAVAARITPLAKSARDPNCTWPPVLLWASSQ